MDSDDKWASPSNRFAREVRLWLSAIAGLFLLLLVALVYRINGFGSPTPRHVIVPEPGPPVELVADAHFKQFSPAYKSGETDVEDHVVQQFQQESPEEARPLERSSAKLPALPSKPIITIGGDRPRDDRDRDHNDSPAETAGLKHPTLRQEGSNDGKTSFREHMFDKKRSPTAEEELEEEIKQATLIEPVSEKEGGSVFKSFPIPADSKREPVLPNARTIESSSLTPSTPTSPSSLVPQPVEENLTSPRSFSNALRSSSPPTPESLLPARSPSAPPLDDEADEQKDRQTQSVVVKLNESYWSIALNLYGDGRLFRALHEVNRDRLGEGLRLEPGALVITPSLEVLMTQVPNHIPSDIRKNLENTDSKARLD